MKFQIIYWIWDYFRGGGCWSEIVECSAQGQSVPRQRHIIFENVYTCIANLACVITPTIIKFSRTSIAGNTPPLRHMASHTVLHLMKACICSAIPKGNKYTLNKYQSTDVQVNSWHVVNVLQEPFPVCKIKAQIAGTEPNHN